MNVDLALRSSTSTWAVRRKKVCGRLCGSALLQDEALVARILHAVVRAVDVPVTLKIRTGWDPTQKNGARIAKHRPKLRHRSFSRARPHTRRLLQGAAEYDTIREIKI